MRFALIKNKNTLRTKRRRKKLTNLWILVWFFLCWFAHFRWVWSVYCWNVMWIFKSLSTFDTFYIIVILINGQRLKIASGQFGIWHFSLLSADQSCDTVKHATIKFINYVPVTDRIMMLQFQIGVFNVCDSMQRE